MHSRYLICFTYALCLISITNDHPVKHFKGFSRTDVMAQTVKFWLMLCLLRQWILARITICWRPFLDLQNVFKPNIWPTRCSPVKKWIVWRYSCTCVMCTVYKSTRFGTDLVPQVGSGITTRNEHLIGTIQQGQYFTVWEKKTRNVPPSLLSLAVSMRPCPLSDRNALFVGLKAFLLWMCLRQNEHTIHWTS